MTRIRKAVKRTNDSKTSKDDQSYNKFIFLSVSEIVVRNKMLSLNCGSLSLISSQAFLYVCGKNVGRFHMLHNI